jgi:hypothetical protein
MGDRILAGSRTVGTFVPIQLYAGEADVVTTQGVLASGQKVGQLNEREETFKFPVVALVAGKLIAYDKENGVAGANVPYGVLPHALDASATGYNADTNTPVIIGGVLNFDALDADGQTYAALKAAFALAGNSNLIIQRLY